ncbi:MAG TPA: hypothetical protein VMH00_13905 [Candidatus Limnocylindrales bacterium]|nr:hypothetical protein [Candidatus Limnocylindrales bacterium]
MSKVIQIRNVPEGVYRALKAQAAVAGMSLSGFLLDKIRHLAETQTLAQLRERMRHRSRVASLLSAAKAVRRERDASE